MLYKFVYVKTPSFGCQIFFRCCGNLWKHHIANFSDVPKSCKNNGLANKPLEAILTNGKWFFCVRIGGSEICWEFFFRKNWQSGKYASKLNSFSISQIGKISWMTGFPEASIIFCTFFTSQRTIGYQSFEASRKMTRHQQSLTWHGFDTTSI